MADETRAKRLIIKKEAPTKKPIRLDMSAAYASKPPEEEDVVVPRSLSRPGTDTKASPPPTKPVPESAPVNGHSTKSESVFKFYCVYCGQKLSALAPMAGKRISCPACSRNITIPNPV